MQQFTQISVEMSTIFMNSENVLNGVALLHCLSM